MAVISIGKVTRLRDERELDLNVPGGAEPPNKAELDGELEAYALSLKLLESFGKKMEKIINARIVGFVEMTDACKRRVEMALTSVKTVDMQAVESSEGKTMMLEYLKGHQKAVEEVIRILADV
jgi:hypothetical protein